MTRDRVAYDAEWAGRRFTLVDTGGWEVDANGIHLRVAEQAEIAIDLADVVHVRRRRHRRRDRRRRGGRQAAAPLRQAGRARGQQGRRPARPRPTPPTLWNLGLGQPYPVSALHGRGSGDVLDAVLDVLPDVSADGDATPQGGPRRVALRRAPQRRQVRACSTSSPARTASSSTTSPAPPATRSTSSSSSAARRGASSTPPASVAGCTRRRGADFYASLRTQTALEKAEVAVVLIDAEQPIAEQDIRVVQQVIDAGPRPRHRLQQVGPARRGAPLLPRARDRAELVQVPWAPRVNISAKHRAARRPARAGARDGARVVGHPRPDRPAQRVPRRDRGRPPAPGARRQAAAHPVRDPGRRPARRGS